MAKKLYDFISSLRLTVVCLGFALVLVFVGTLAQVEQGLYQAQARFFKSFIIYWNFSPTMKVPVLPGGYLLGTVLLVNLLAAHFKRFTFSKKKTGIFMVHFGLILLLLGQLFTDVLSRESAMRLEEGETKNYSEDFHANELVLIDTSDPQGDEVVSIPEGVVAREKEIRHAKLPVTLRVASYWQNSDLLEKAVPMSIPVGATQGVGRNAHLIVRKPVTDMESRNLPSAVIEVLTSAGTSLGTWLVSSQFSQKQTFSLANKTYQLAMRFTRHYKPYSLTLLDFTHERYPGTDKPKDFRSRVRLTNSQKNEDREVEIFMNNPLRYDGLTFYQASFEPGDTVTVLQVVRNPSWLTPYFACVLVGAGLIVQFMMHLMEFVKKRKTK
jgi:hypothetical protein